MRLHRWVLVCICVGQNALYHVDLNTDLLDYLCLDIPHSTRASYHSTVSKVLIYLPDTNQYYNAEALPNVIGLAAASCILIESQNEDKGACRPLFLTIERQIPSNPMNIE